MLFLLLFLVHGAIWLAIKSEGDLNKRARSAAAGIWIVLVIVAVAFLVASYFATNLYVNYFENPALFIVIAITVVALLGIRVFIYKGALWKAWFSSAVTIISATFFGVIGLFPNMFPSSMDREFNLTAHNASSSPLTLKIMLIVACIFVPIVLIYQIWAYNLFKGKVGEGDYEKVY
jgi:cytochrome d ubiquinol oxidase subunit II